MRRMMLTVLQRCAGPVRTSLSRSEFHTHPNRMLIFAQFSAAGPGVDEIVVRRCPARSSLVYCPSPSVGSTEERAPLAASTLPSGL